jgi:hypothetical protein
MEIIEILEDVVLVKMVSLVRLFFHHHYHNKIKIKKLPFLKKYVQLTTLDPVQRSSILRHNATRRFLKISKFL